MAVRRSGEKGHDMVTQADYVQARIEEKISCGQLRPGQRVEELVLAEEFGTSRTPVREALAKLVSSGLLRKSPHQGAVVARLDLAEVLAIMEYSAELAGTCARFATRRMSDAELRGLHAMCDLLQQHLLDNELAAYTTQASRFHAAIIEYSRNAYLIEAVGRSVLLLSGLFRFDLTYPDTMRRDLAEHRQLLDAFDRKDPEGARQLMRHHALLSTDAVRDYLAFLDAQDG
jgi:DNA-binding GntR family transcriptional regulator